MAMRYRITEEGLVRLAELDEGLQSKPNPGRPGTLERWILTGLEGYEDLSINSNSRFVRGVIRKLLSKGYIVEVE